MSLEENDDIKLEYLLRRLLRTKRDAMFLEFHRHVSTGDLLSDRYETASYYGFGEGTSCYDNVLIIGNVKVGRESWIGPNVILDGSGGLIIGNFVSISAGVQIYSHDTVQWSTSLGAKSKEFSQTRIGNGVYIGPNSVIQRGVEIGDQSVIGAMSFVNSNIPAGARAYGVPARIM